MDEGLRFRSLIETILDACNRGSGTAAKSEVHQCRPCHLDFQLECRDLDGMGLAIVVTKWLDLGAGLGMIPGKYKGADLIHALLDRSEENSGASNQIGEIRLAFEKENGLSQEEISLRNASYLRKKRYRRIMGGWPVGTWILQAGQPVPSGYDWGTVLFLVLAVPLLLVFLGCASHQIFYALYALYSESS